MIKCVALLSIVPDPDPDTWMDSGLCVRMVWGLQDPAPSINKQKNWKKTWFYLSCDFFMTCYLWRSLYINTRWKSKKFSKKNLFFGHLKSHWQKEQDPQPKQFALESVMQCTDPRIRIRICKLWIRNTGINLSWMDFPQNFGREALVQVSIWSLGQCWEKDFEICGDGKRLIK